LNSANNRKQMTERYKLGDSKYVIKLGLEPMLVAAQTKDGTRCAMMFASWVMSHLAL